MTTRDVGTFQTPAGRTFEGYWDTQSGRVYLKLQRTAFRSSPIEAGVAHSEEEARARIDATLQQVRITWI
ncbi:MAG: hypothetical protein OHK0039_42410 [Bacteroidia bacterium]